MALETWPSNLPNPDAIEHQPEDALHRTDMAGGPARVRVMYTDVPVMVPTQWTMTGLELKIFRAFFVNKINRGADWFDGPVFKDSVYVTRTQRFKGPYGARYRTFDAWVVQAVVEIQDGLYEAGDESLIT